MKTVLGIFAHPDDEAFGPGGTLAKLSSENEVYLICVTNGDAEGKTKLQKKKNGEIRKKELLESAKILGVKRVFFLGYGDGMLSNSLYHKIADEISMILKRLQPGTIITFEQRGISGHIDHIAVSLITTFVFIKLKFVKKLMYYCISQEHRRDIKNYFIYMPPGYDREEVDEVIDVSPYWDTKVAAMKQHQSQKSDVNMILKSISKYAKEEYFLVLKKE